MRQIGFAQAYEVIAHDPARVLQSFFRPNRYLGGQPLSATVHRRADDRGKPGIEERLAAHHHERPVQVPIAARFLDRIEFTPFHVITSLVRCLLSSRRNDGAVLFA